jgi:intracellular septation protein
MNRSQFLKLFEFLSLVAFGLAYWLYDLRIATATLMVFSTLFVMVAGMLHEKLTHLQWGTWGVIIILGTFTILSQNDNIIKWKPTILNMALAIAFGFSHWIGEKTLLERMLHTHFTAPAYKLRKISQICVVYFLGIAILNLLVAYSFDTSVWVKFKLIGLFVFNGIFVSGCVYYLREEMKIYLEKQGHK